MTKKFTSHYSGGLNTQWLNEGSMNGADALLAHPAIIGKRVVLVFTGFSGTAWAIGLSLEMYKRGSPVGMLFVRKEGDVSHGSPVHTEEKRFDNCCFVFVDDFVDSGQTLRRMDLVTANYGGIQLLCLRGRLEERADAWIGYHPTEEEVKYYSGLLGDNNAE
jgi:hypothetical protein